MSAIAPDYISSRTVLKLLVRNHAGVMSHICGLFSRRAFNLEGILCMPVGDGSCSGMMLMVDEDERLDQLIAQLEKLEDVLEIHRQSDGQRAFEITQLFVQDLGK